MDKICMHCGTPDIVCLRTGARFTFKGKIRNGDAFHCKRCLKISLYGINPSVEEGSTRSVHLYLANDGADGALENFPSTSRFQRAIGVEVVAISKDMEEHVATWYDYWWQQVKRDYEVRDA